MSILSFLSWRHFILVTSSSPEANKHVRVRIINEKCLWKHLALTLFSDLQRVFYIWQNLLLSSNMQKILYYIFFLDVHSCPINGRNDNKQTDVYVMYRNFTYIYTLCKAYITNSSLIISYYYSKDERKCKFYLRMQ